MTLHRLAREAYDGQHRDAHLRVHPDTRQTLLAEPPAAPPPPWLSALAMLVGLPVVADDEVPPGEWRLCGNADREIRQTGHVTTEATDG